MAELGWARSRGDSAEQEGLRRGAWYRVVEDPEKQWVVLDVHQGEVRAPRGNLELRKERPKGWSVVHEPHLVCPGVTSANTCRGSRRKSNVTSVAIRLPWTGRIGPEPGLLRVIQMPFAGFGPR